MILRAERGLRPFQFERDTFTFANELVWEYRFHEATGEMRTSPNDPPPTYSHRCFVMVRSARQFFYHAQFEPTAPKLEREVYRELIRQVVARSPRKPSPHGGRIVIPGYDSLRAFSQGQEALLKAGCGSAWESYFLRSHWRMVFPVWRAQQEQVAEALRRALRARPAPIVHLFRFPRITINHGIVVFGLNESGGDLHFEAYDPNIPEHPVSLIYSRTGRSFSFPRTRYWAGGRVSVIEIYRGGLY
jgi:hypothetical protein